MALATYSDLKASVAAWLHRDDLTSVMDDFIALAEEMMWRELRVKEMETTTTVSMTGRTVALPTLPLEVRSAYLDANPIEHLKPMSAAQIEENYEPTNGKPKYYAIVGSNLVFERTPDSSYTMYVTYYKKLAGLSGTTTTSDILTYYPSVYLYGTCLAASQYAQDDANIQRFMSLYNDAVAKANSQTKRTKYGVGMMVRAA